MSNSVAVNALTILGLYLAQNAVHYALPGSPPALVLIGVVYIALYEGALAGAAAGLFAGALLEVLVPGRFGPLVVPYTLSGLLTGLLSGQLFRDSLATQVLLPAVWTVFLTAGAHLAGTASEVDGPGVVEALWLSVWSPGWFWTALAAPPVFRLLRRSRPRPSRRGGRIGPAGGWYGRTGR
ncbi:MAG: hypothetical protein MOGMAGMI_01310 [Candidatus Omnitrophica bacterium]|nr:hypothetical protein [Candidatus Omnitrophota bacterium]